jgi:hypothetical protein
MFVLASHTSADPFVLECHCQPRTNNLGLVQRGIVTALARSPRRFSGSVVHSQAGELLEHGPPAGVTVRALACEAYATTDPSAAQTRAVQRAVRRLASLGLVECWHAQAGTRERAYTTRLGHHADQPVSALFVALVWRCEHRPAP